MTAPLAAWHGPDAATFRARTLVLTDAMRRALARLTAPAGDGYVFTPRTRRTWPSADALVRRGLAERAGVARPCYRLTPAGWCALGQAWRAPNAYGSVRVILPRYLGTAPHPEQVRYVADLSLAAVFPRCPACEHAATYAPRAGWRAADLAAAPAQATCDNPACALPFFLILDPA